MFTAFQSGDNLTISAAVVNPSGNTTFIDAMFPGVRLPSSTCGDRYSFCHVTTYSDLTGRRMVAVAPAGNGAAVVLFDQQDIELNFVNKMFVPLPANSSCVLTAFIGDSPLYGLCYDIQLNNLGGIVKVYKVLFDFEILTESRIAFHSQESNTYLSISEVFTSSAIGTNLIVYWYQNAFLFSLEIGSFFFTSLKCQDSNITQCFDNGTRQVTLFQATSLLAYCEASTVEISLSGNLEDNPPIVITTTFYCSEKRDTFLQVKDGGLHLNSQADDVIPFPLDISLHYVGDCVKINEIIFFVGSSTDGTIALTDVLFNRTTILTTNSLVNHQVVDNRFVLYSDPTSSAILDLFCPVPSTPIYVSNMTFDLSSFFANGNFDCLTIQPMTPSPTTPEVTTENTESSISAEHRTDSDTTFSHDSSIFILPTTVLPSTVLPTILTTILSTTPVPTTLLPSTVTPTTFTPSSGEIITVAVVVPIVFVIFVVVFTVVVVIVLTVLCTRRKVYRWANFLCALYFNRYNNCCFF